MTSGYLPLVGYFLLDWRSIFWVKRIKVANFPSLWCTSHLFAFLNILESSLSVGEEKLPSLQGCAMSIASG